jgi:putative transposase
LVICPPKLAVANLVGKLKGKSSFVLRRDFGHQLRKKLWGDHLWSPSYASVTCVGAPLEIVKKYIDDQKRPPSQKGIEISTRENTRNSPGGKKPGTVARH